MRKALWIIDKASELAGGVAVFLVIGIAVLIVAEVASRSFFGFSMSFAWEFSAYFHASAIFLGAAYTMRTGGHVRVSLFSGLLGPKGAHGLDIAATLLGAALAGFLAFATSAFAWRSFVQGSVSPTVDQTPLAIPQGAIALGAVLLFLQMLARAYRLFVGEAPEDQDAKNTFAVE